MCHFRLCLAIIIVLPITTPKELKNNVSYTLGNFTNRMCIFLLISFLVTDDRGFAVVYDWLSGFAFILSFIAPVWTICVHFAGQP